MDIIAGTNLYLTTCSISTEEVTLPTPPGTGVIAATLGSTESKSTSPQSFEVSSSQLIPASIMVWCEEK